MVFEFKRKNSSIALREKLERDGFYFELVKDEVKRRILLYKLIEEEEDARDPYLGYTLSEVMNSGEDLLAKKLCEKGEPDFSEVKKALPKIEEGAYAFLGGPASWAGVTVEPDGSVVHQLSGRDREPRAIFDPKTVDPVLCKVLPKRMLVGGEYPIMIALYTDGVEALELMYFVEPGDTDRDPVVWIRIKKYRNSTPDKPSVSYRVAAISREGDEFIHGENPPTEGIFLEALCDTVCYWTDFYDSLAEIAIPEKELERVARGSVSFAALTFTGAHPHYGHKFYGKELHDNFPPNYIWAIEAACLVGKWEWAKDIFDGMVRYALNEEGKMCYRQGLGLCFGVSATEYGMLLYLANKYKDILVIRREDEKTVSKLCGMADQILSNCHPCPEFSGRVLVKMCAEADTNERINVYLNNNLWAIRGFTSLSSLLRMLGKDSKAYDDMAALLSENVNALINEYSARDTRFGTLVPFRFEYTPTPLTLSSSKDTFYEISEEELSSYLNSVRTRGPESSKQDFTENTYSNYRYYPEALCSMLLPDELADSIVRMRESLGGEVLGMTRFRSWIDNWPVLNYARFLIESGRIEKYLLLLYAHTAHHGRADLMAYYEQVSFSGEVRANDCVPSLLTVPIMLAWAFSYERIADGRLQLLSAIPKKWFEKGFCAHGICYSGGRLDIEYASNTLTLSASSPLPRDTEIVWRGKEAVSMSDVICGREQIKEIRANRLILIDNIKNIKITVK